MSTKKREEANLKRKDFGDKTKLRKLYCKVEDQDNNSEKIIKTGHILYL